MSTLIYILCALTSLACAVLLLRSYAVRRDRLLFWSSLCFVGLFINNLLLVADLLMLPEVDLSTVRLVSALAALLPLLYGLIWEEE